MVCSSRDPVLADDTRRRHHDDLGVVSISRNVLLGLFEVAFTRCDVADGSCNHRRRDDGATVPANENRETSVVSGCVCKRTARGVRFRLFLLAQTFEIRKAALRMGRRSGSKGTGSETVGRCPNRLERASEVGAKTKPEVAREQHYANDNQSEADDRDRYQGTR